jgi:Cft2 family RNA processing exonuclease
MCEAGRILHHLRFKIHNPKNTILIVGYMAAHTLGRRILDQGLAYETSGRKESPPVVKIFNKEYPLKARVVRMGGFSAHADKSELLRFITKSNLRIKNIAVVHGMVMPQLFPRRGKQFAFESSGNRYQAPRTKVDQNAAHIVASIIPSVLECEALDLGR